MRFEGIYIRSDGKYEVWIKITNNGLECAGVANSEIGAKDLWQECYWFSDKKQPYFYNDDDLEQHSKLKKEENIAILSAIDNRTDTLKQTIKKLINQYGMQNILETLISHTNEYNIHNVLYLCRLSEGLQATLNVYLHRY